MQLHARASRVVLAGAIGLAVLSVGGSLRAHDVITTEITWNTEIARIVYSRCATCHRPEGSAFSLLTYNEARPWAVAIKEEILTRRMPPWGAANGFGSFRNAMDLTPEEIERVVEWVDGGVPEAPEPKANVTAVPGDPASSLALPNESGQAAADPVRGASPPEPPDFSGIAPYQRPSGELLVSGEFELPRAFNLDGIWPGSVPSDASLRILAQLPDGAIEPLVWLDGYREEFSHPFLLRRPLELPRGTLIHGVPEDASIALLPVPEE